MEIMVKFDKLRKSTVVAHQKSIVIRSKIHFNQVCRRDVARLKRKKRTKQLSQRRTNLNVLLYFRIYGCCKEKLLINATRRNAITMRRRNNMK